MVFSIIKQGKRKIPRDYWNWVTMKISLQFTKGFNTCHKPKTISAVETAEPNKRQKGYSMWRKGSVLYHIDFRLGGKIIVSRFRDQRTQRVALKFHT